MEGNKHRAWAFAGYGWMVDTIFDEPLLMLADDKCPVVCLPAGLTEKEHEVLFGWAFAELIEQRRGWVGLLRFTQILADEAA